MCAGRMEHETLLYTAVARSVARSTTYFRFYAYLREIQFALTQLNCVRERKNENSQLVKTQQFEYCDFFSLAEGA